jgi:hypothetical protein
MPHVSAAFVLYRVPEITQDSSSLTTQAEGEAPAHQCLLASFWAVMDQLAQRTGQLQRQICYLNKEE